MNHGESEDSGIPEKHKVPGAFHDIIKAPDTSNTLQRRSEVARQKDIHFGKRVNAIVELADPMPFVLVA